MLSSLSQKNGASTPPARPGPRALLSSTFVWTALVLVVWLYTLFACTFCKTRLPMTSKT